MSVIEQPGLSCHVSQLDEGWDRWIPGEVQIPGLEAESYMRVRDTNPADLVLDSGMFPELT